MKQRVRIGERYVNTTKQRYNMKIFKSHKEVSPTPMNRLEWVEYRGWELPADEDGSDEGYLVEYLDGGKPNHPDHKGYISWSPKEQFDNGYTEVKLDSLTFGEAVEAMKAGEKVARTGWNGKNMFLYYVPCGVYPARMGAIKGDFVDDMVPYGAYIALKTAQDEVVPWLASQTDMLSYDWVCV